MAQGKRRRVDNLGLAPDPEELLELVYALQALGAFLCLFKSGLLVGVRSDEQRRKSQLSTVLCRCLRLG
jgi:hypothetical protein